MNPDNLVNAAQIAERAEVAEITVKKWRERHEDFPEQVARGVWYWPRVRDWLKRTGRL